jgi:hypothetical protein
MLSRNSTVVMVSDKNYQCILKVENEKYVEEQYCGG